MRRKKNISAHSVIMNEKFSKGDKIWVLHAELDGLIAATLHPGRSEAIITAVHPTEKKPYDIRFLHENIQAICSEEAILSPIYPTCDCGTEEVYHEKEKGWVCPFCEL